MRKIFKKMLLGLGTLSFVASLSSCDFLPNVLDNGSKETTCEHEFGELISEVLATCTVAGHKSYYRCEKCKKYFNENKERVELSDLVINPLGHSYDVTYTWSNEKCTANAICTRDPEHVMEETVSGEFVEDTAATCEEAKKGHYHAVFSSSYLSPQDTETNSVTMGEAKGHTLELVEGQDSTDVEDGWKSYYQCTVCKKCFEDEQGSVFISNIEEWKQTDGKIDKTNWSNPV